MVTMNQNKFRFACKALSEVRIKVVFLKDTKDSLNTYVKMKRIKNNLIGILMLFTSVTGFSQITGTVVGAETNESLPLPSPQLDSLLYLDSLTNEVVSYMVNSFDSVATYEVMSYIVNSFDSVAVYETRNTIDSLSKIELHLDSDKFLENPTIPEGFKVISVDRYLDLLDLIDRGLINIETVRELRDTNGTWIYLQKENSL